MKAKHAAMSILATAAISLAGAAVFMRSPVLWDLLPSGILGTVELLFAVHTQEEENSLEFLSTWLVLFLTTGVIVAAIAMAWRWLRKPTPGAR